MRSAQRLPQRAGLPAPRLRQAGFILILALAFLAGIMALIAVGTSRSLTERAAAERYVAKQQAFYLAEAGFDAELVNQQDKTPAAIQTLIDQPPVTVTLAGSSTYTIDYQEAGTSTDDLALLVVTGAAGLPGGETVTQTLRSVWQFPAAAAPGTFDYAIASGRLRVQSSVLGASNERIPLYVKHYDTQQTVYFLDVTPSSTVWVSNVDFYNPNNLTLADLCPYCADPSVFPTTPPPAPVFNISGVKELPSISIDLTPYYVQAKAQQGVDGQSYHYITADTIIDGGKTGRTLEGIIYVEAGVNLTFKNKVTVKGTIAHEGRGEACGSTNKWPYYACDEVAGGLSLASGAAATIDSYATTRDFNGDGWPDEPFAEGLAVVGAPFIDWQNTSTLGDGTSANPGIKGFVMAGTGLQSCNGCGRRTSSIASTGVIQGGLIGAGTIMSQTLDYPGPSDVLYAYLDDVQIGGNANIRFKPLPKTPPGFPSTSPSSGSGSSSDRPTSKVWLAN